MQIYYSLTNQFNLYLQRLDTEFSNGKGGTRPHIYIPLIIDQINVLLPIRSYANHRHVFKIKDGRVSYIDYTKAIIIESSKLNNQTTPYMKNLNQESHIYIQNNEEKIKRGFIRYLKIYKNAHKSRHVNEGSSRIVEYSTLKNFHSELNI